MRPRLTAFGLEVESDWPLPGSAPRHGRTPDTSVELVPGERMDAEFARPAKLIFEPPYPDGKSRVRVELGDGRYRLWFDGFGRFLVAGDGAWIRCEEGAFPRERVERLVFAQCLPLAAALRGLELLHASAVAIDGGVVAFAGRSGAGKTGLAGRLVLRGAELVADDVLALDGVLAHPGPAMIVVRAEDAALLERAAELGPAVGESDKLHVALPTVDAPLPLRTLYDIEPGRRVEIEPAQEVDARSVLSGVFAPYLATPERLRRHLDTARLLSEEVQRFRLRLPRGHGLDEAAAAVEAHLRERVPA